MARPRSDEQRVTIQIKLGLRAGTDADLQLGSCLISLRHDRAHQPTPVALRRVDGAGNYILITTACNSVPSTRIIGMRVNQVYGA